MKKREAIELLDEVVGLTLITSIVCSGSNDKVGHWELDDAMVRASLVAAFGIAIKLLDGSLVEEVYGGEAPDPKRLYEGLVKVVAATYVDMKGRE